MVKVHTTLSVDSELIEKAKLNLINISALTERAIEKAINIKKIEIEEGYECEYCEKKMPQANLTEPNGLMWCLPDEKWICPKCLHESTKKLLYNSEHPTLLLKK